MAMKQELQVYTLKLKTVIIVSLFNKLNKPFCCWSRKRVRSESCVKMKLSAQLLNQFTNGELNVNDKTRYGINF